MMRSIELFAGAGGLGIGTCNAGFNPVAVIEWNHWACDTIRENQAHGLNPFTHWPLFEGDVRKFDYSSVSRPIDIVTGGPPCQPFSLGGKHRGHLDKRDMFPEAIRAVRELRPKAFMFENVKGLTRSTFGNYLQYIRLQLRHPELLIKSDEEWTDHLQRLENHEIRGKCDGLHYNVLIRVLNAANYGVPQRRERVFIVGFRADTGVKWHFPEETHSREALLYSKWRTGEYWDENCVAKKERPMKPRNVFKLSHDLFQRERWVTIRDAIRDLPDPEKEIHAAREYGNHVFMPGARSYPGHTGSPLDEPSKTLKAGDHGVPGGENMLRRPDGSLRYFTVRESARLQTFPDAMSFRGSWTESMRLLGNAVPVKLAQVVASSIYNVLKQTS